jgi:hypothetical protein
LAVLTDLPWKNAWILAEHARVGENFRGYVIDRLVDSGVEVGQGSVVDR